MLLFLRINSVISNLLCVWILSVETVGVGQYREVGQEKEHDAARAVTPKRFWLSRMNTKSRVLKLLEVDTIQKQKPEE